MMQSPAPMLVVFGGLIVLIGLLWLFGPSIPWLGRLPGDIAVERENFRFYFPLATCLLISLLLTAALWIVSRFTR